MQQLDRDIVDDSRKAKQKPKPAGAPAVVAKVCVLYYVMERHSLYH